MTAPANTGMSTDIPMEDFPDLSGQVTKLKTNSIALGGFSDVYLGEWTDPQSGAKKIVAIKILRGVHLNGPELLAKLAKRLERESTIWQQFDHPNILPFLGLATDDALGPFPALISPFCNRGCVLDAIQSDPKIERFPLILGVASGLQYLHEKDAVHGDLKAQNVLMSDNGRPLLSDFGRSKFIARRGYTTDFACAYRYLAPELMDSDPSLARAVSEDGTQVLPSTTKHTDVYSFSLIGVEVLSGLPAYPRCKQDFQVLYYVSKGGRPKEEDYPRVELPPETASVWPVLARCWVRNPEERPSMDAVLTELSAL